MSSAERRTRRPSAMTALALFAAMFAALLPLTRVIAADLWVAGALGVVALVLATGYAARLLGLAAGVATALEALVWFLFTMVVFLAGTGFAAVIPTAATFSTASGYVQSTVQEIALGAAPLPVTVALSFCIVTAFGALAIVMDHVVVTTRMPLLAAVALVAVWLIPSVVVPGRFDVVAFVLLAASILLLLRTETRTRVPAQRTAPAAAVALGIGAVAIVTALVVTPLLPTPPARTDLSAGGAALGISADLDLGRDLRQPRTTEVLTLRSSSAPRVPYLRVATLSTLEGDIWQPDAGATAPLSGDTAFSPLSVDPGIEVVETTTTVTVDALSSPWLPIPYATVGLSGLAGAWTTSAENRTVVGDGTTTANQTYTVVSQAAKPTLEQIRARAARGSGDDARYTRLPDGMPDSIGALAREVTAGTRDDYDALLAMQRWFRGSDFSYSLETPVAEGFDGSGVDAVARFLEVRKGYCVHFASAFALMARSLGMPTRIVVGYLPGTSTGGAIDGQRVFSVASSQLHAWPEVYFEGIGWVGFDPTKGLGEPTSFSPSSSLATGGTTSSPTTDEPADQAASPTPTPTPSASSSATGGSASADHGGGLGGGIPLGVLAVGVLLLLCIPAVTGVLRRRAQRAEAVAGRAEAAWALVQDTAVDLGIDVPASETPRAFGARLVAGHDVDPVAMDVLVSAIERSAYAPVRQARLGERILADEAVAVRAALRASAPSWRRALAAVLPRSLVIRPGSAFAASGRPARAG
jgi:transglutaminase-like putative cysteine protease